MIDRLRRVTDLFVEGTECHLGMDDDGSAVLVWVNKLNSFEVEEARQDGLTARGMAILQLSKEDNPERAALEMALGEWSDDDLLDGLVAQHAEELYLDVLNDLEADEDWAEKIQIIRRLPVLLADSNAPDDDERRADLVELQKAYLDAVAEGRKRAEAAYRAEFRSQSREALEKAYFENWRSKSSLNDFMAARRTTELFYAIRDCAATEAGRDVAGKIRWDHSRCSHRRLLNERSQVRELPETVLDRVSQTLDEISVPQRAAGNSVAPQSSSESAEQPNVPEDSTPSTPEVTQPALLTT